jgi:hypothetical protein
VGNTGNVIVDGNDFTGRFEDIVVQIAKGSNKKLAQETATTTDEDGFTCEALSVFPEVFCNCGNVFPDECFRHDETIR